MSETASLSSKAVREILDQNGVSCSDEQWARLEAWASNLLSINQQINLISRTNTEHFWEQHILHSLSVLALCDLPHNLELCDFGTGGGLPGVPLAIMRPDWDVVLLDARQKKIRAIEATLSSLGLSNIRWVSGRGEELGQTPAYQNRFRWFTARAVSALSNLEAWTRTLRTPRANLIAYKGGVLSDENIPPHEIPNLAQCDELLIDLKSYHEFARQEKKLVTLRFC
jgi:16S rRNA (guanine527-N7)-methyltransferase